MSGEGGPGPGAPALTWSAVERARQIVDQVLADAALSGERIAAWARIALCGVMAVTWPVTTWREMANGEGAVLGAEAISIAGLLVSCWLLLRLSTGCMTRSLTVLSTVCDAVLVLAFLAGFVVWPPKVGYFGLGRMAGLGTVYLAIFGAGLRLSRGGAALSVGLHVVGLVALFVLDFRLNPTTDTAPNVVTVFALVVSAGLASAMMVRRTRDLVLASAQQTLLAERVRARLGAYVSEEVAAASLEDDEMRLGGARQDVSILFADLRSFTTSAEEAPPERVVAELNEYFEAMVTAVRAQGGVVDKYIGDAVMAVFGAPRAHPDDALRAVQAAIGMERSLELLNQRRAARGLVPLRHGIGLHHGPVVAGNIGTTDRAQYTVIGDAVNVAARLEAATKEHDVSVLLSDAVVRASGAASLSCVRPVGEVKVKGRVQPIVVYALDGP
jgi:class 3 adenylate cyclase